MEGHGEANSGGGSPRPDPEARIAHVRALITAEEQLVGRRSIGLVDWLGCLCTAAVRALPVSGAGVSVMTDGGVRGLAAASDAVGVELEELQFMLGEGPSLDAFHSRRPVLEPDLDDGAIQRWPGYSAGARARGVRAVFAFPLQLGAARLGVLDLYRLRPGSLAMDSLAQALTFAEVAVQTLLDGQASVGRGEVAVGLERALDSRLVLYQAQGVVMVDLRVSIGDAMARLRAHAYTQDRPLQDVAHDIVEGRLRLEADG